jgi:hypothetical protein
MVDLSPEEVVTLGGDPSPPPSHPPCPSSPGPCLVVLFEVARHVSEPNDILHLLSNHLISLVSGGCKVDVQITKKDWDMPLWACIPGSLNVCQHCKIGRRDVAPHSIVPFHTRHHHKGDNIWSIYLPFLDLIKFVRFLEEGDPSLSDADRIRCKDIVTTQKASVNAPRDFCFH